MGDVHDLDLLVLGDCNPDLVVTGGDVVPAFGQTEKLVDEARLVIGGSAAITACGAARLGLATALVAVVGDDVFGRFMLDRLRERGVDTCGVAVSQTEQTGLSIALVRGDDRAILTAPGTIDSLTAADVDRALLCAARHAHVSSFFLLPRLGSALAELFAEARAAGLSTSVDPNWDPSGAWDGGLRDVLGVTDILFANEEEVRALAGSGDAEIAARTLAGNGTAVVVKCGSAGAFAVDGDELVRVGSAEVDVADTVGAGDSFNAGFLAARLEGTSLRAALELAVACGALSTRAVGGTEGQPTRAEADAW